MKKPTSTYKCMYLDRLTAVANNPKPYWLNAIKELLKEFNSNANIPGLVVLLSSSPESCDLVTQVILSMALPFYKFKVISGQRR